MGVFTPQKLAEATKQPYSHPESQLLTISQHICPRMMSRSHKTSWTFPARAGGEQQVLRGMDSS